MKKVILFLIIITAVSEGCKKYEEGPWFSLRSAKNRLYGDYTLIQYTVNGIDSLSLFYDSLCLNIKIYYEDVNYVNRFDIYGNRKDGKLSQLIWTWELTNKNKILRVTSSGGNKGTGPFGYNKKPDWEIVKLSNKIVKMKTSYNGKEYQFELQL